MMAIASHVDQETKRILLSLGLTGIKQLTTFAPGRMFLTNIRVKSTQIYLYKTKNVIQTKVLVSQWQYGILNVMVSLSQKIHFSP